jgi:signal transduction histidine kinase
VTVRVEALDGTSVRLTVEDEGPGLPSEVRSRLFTPHVTTKPSGSGMGLFLAYRIATARYGGSLVLEERVPRGTRAVFTAGPRAGGRPA